MSQIPPHGELVRITSNSSNNDKKRLTRLRQTGKAIQLAKGLYVVGSTISVKDTVRHHFYEIAALYWPNGVFVGKSALSSNLKDNDQIFVTNPDLGRSTPLVLGGVTIIPILGPGHIPGDALLPSGMSLSGSARRLLENVTLEGKPPKWKAGREKVEDAIEEIVRTGGTGRISKILKEITDSDEITKHFNPTAVMFVKTRLVEILGTISSGAPAPRSKKLAARLSNNPVDFSRIESLTNLVKTLGSKPPNPSPAFSPTTHWEWLPFFEAYFSNFIEGTEFEVDEAYKIAIEDFISPTRPKDSHDISASYRLTSDAIDSIRIPSSGAELLEILRDRHERMMAARPEVSPGEFKRVPNRVGAYHFVQPELVIGTLLAGFDVMNVLENPLARAIAMTALVTECHPFNDGNGRISRMMSNAELSAKDEVRIVIPTNQRESYLTALHAYSDKAVGGEPLYQVMSFAQRWTSKVDWSDYAQAKATLEKLGAFEVPNDAQGFIGIFGDKF